MCSRLDYFVAGRNSIVAFAIIETELLNCVVGNPRCDSPSVVLQIFLKAWIGTEETTTFQGFK